MILYLILLGALAGFLAGLILKGRGFGFFINILLGIAGSFVGGWVLKIVGISFGYGMFGRLITATLGAILLILLVNLIRGKRR